MVISCVAYGCTYRFEKGSSISFFRFPKEENRRELWIRALKRDNWRPSAYSRICGKHFQTGKPSTDLNHPDYIPNVFTFTKSKKTAHLYEKRKLTLEKKNNTSSVPLSILDFSDEDTDTAEESGPEPENEEDTSRSDELKSLYMELQNLQAEKRALQERVASLDPTSSILGDSSMLNLYTGLVSISVFDWILKIMDKEIEYNFISKKTQLLIVLMKLKQNLLASDIAFRFNVSRKSVQKIFDLWMPSLAGKLKSLIFWPSKKALKKNCPKCFQNSKFRHTVCIIDCTEVPIQKPNSQEAKSQTWSNYKHSHTIKFLVAVTPSGHICFLSEAWGGRASDKEITLQSGFLNNIEANDVVLADRGFILSEYFETKKAKLIVPAFTKGKKQLSKFEVNFSKQVSNVRIHVERVIRVLKKFRILQTTIPIQFLKYIDSVLIITAGLSNMSISVVKDKEENN